MEIVEKLSRRIDHIGVNIKFVLNIEIEARKSRYLSQCDKSARHV